MNIVVFDVEGIVQLPGFPQLVSEFEAQGIVFIFWSSASNHIAKKALEEQGLSQYIPKLIDANSQQNFQDSLWALQFLGRNSRINRAQILSGIKDFLEIRGLPFQEEQLGYFKQTYQEWEIREMRLAGYKFPKALGQDRYLLVESDATMEDRLEPHGIKRDNTSLAYLHLAREEGFSILLTPEPLVWNHLPIQDIPPLGSVTKSIRDTVLNWHGQLFARDLGKEMGVYREIRTSGEKLNNFPRKEK